MIRMTRRSAVLAIAALSVLLYATSIFNSFAYDDVAVIRDDARVHSLRNIPTIFATNYWNNQSQAIYRPLTTTSFALDWAVAKRAPGWYHVVNTAWNAAACVLVFLVLLELYPLIPAFAGALLFAVHPVHVEAVANIVGRAELMAAAFGMGAALIWMRARTGPLDSQPKMRNWFIAPALFFLAMLSKESAIMCPALYVLLDLASGRLVLRNITTWVRDRFAMLLAFAVAAALFLLQRATVLTSFTPSNLDAALEVAPHGTARVFTALQIWPQYLRLFLFPRILLADYGPRILMPQTSVTLPVIVGAAMLIALLGGGIGAAWRGHGRTAMALLWAPVALLPVSNLLFPIGIILAERTLYLPLLALSMGVAGIVTALRHASLRTHRILWFGLALVSTTFAVRTLVRIPDWKDTGTVFSALARSRPDSFRAAWHSARLAANARDTARALREYDRAIHLWPFRARLLKEASDYAARQHSLHYARAFAEQGVRAWPKDPDFRRSLAGITLDLGDTAQAVTQIDEGLRLKPDDAILNAMRAAVSRGKSQ